MADAAKFYGWGPAEAASVTGTELAWWVAQADRIRIPLTKEAGRG